MRRLDRLWIYLALVPIIGCTPVAAPPPQTPPPAADASQPAREQAPPKETTSPIVLAPAPRDCDRFTAHTRHDKPGESLEAGNAEACPQDEGQRLIRIDAALAQTDPLARDELLAQLEPCAGHEPGLVRALRADLAPLECADTLIDPLLAAATESSTEVLHTLRGLSMAARLLRTSDQPPVIAPPFTRDKFNQFLNESIRPWYLSQSRAVFELASAGAKLSGYGKAIVAIEAGLSDLRFVENVRKIELPAEMSSDREIAEVYRQSLEDALEPRKLRGRDAILVGFLQLGQLGVLSDARLNRARAQLSRLFAGSRIDALEALMLPDLPPLSSSTPVERLAAKLPSFYAARLLPAAKLCQSAALRALIERGLPPKLRQELDRCSRTSPELARLFARGQLEIGRRYFRPAEFTRAAILLEQKGVMAGPSANESRFVAALAHALEGGPENAVQLMLAGPMLPKGMGRVEALETLARGISPLAGMSAFDAGHLLSIIPQDRPSVDHWLRIARHFDEAERKLLDPARKALARERAKDARATAEEVRNPGSQNPS